MDKFTHKSTAQLWLDRIKNARTARTHCEEDWEENRRMINASSYIDRPSQYDRVWVNHMLSLTRIVVPLLYYKNPEFTCLPMREQDEPRYRVVQEAINHWAKVIKLKHPAKEAILDALVASFGCLKVGWVIEEVELKVAVDEAGNKTVVDESKDIPLSAAQVHLVQAGIGSRPFTLRVSPWNIVRNVGSTSIKNASWVAERIFKRLGEVKKDKQYKHTKDLRPNATPMMEARDFSGDGMISMNQNGDDIAAARALIDPDDELVELWEIWDRSDPSEPKRYVIAEGVDKPLLEDDWPYDLDGRFPYIELRLVDVPDEPYPVSFLSAVKELIRELNIISTYELDFVKRANPRVAYDKNVITDENEIQALKRGEPGNVLGINGDPNRAFAQVGGANLSPDLKWVHMKAQENLQLISGIGDIFRGGEAQPGELATVANIRSQALSVMVQDLQDRVSDMMVEWAEDIDMLAKEYCDKPEMIRITGQVGFSWTSFSKTDLQGKYEHQIVPGSLQPMNKEVELKQRLDFFNLVAPFINPMEMQINGKELVRAIAEVFPIKGLNKILMDEQPPPPAVPAEENFLIQEGGSPTVSPEEDFDEHLAIHTQWLEQLLSNPSVDPALIYRLKKHIVDTYQEQLKQMALQQMMGQGMGMGMGMPGQPTQLNRGPGNGGPANNNPIRPRLMSEQQPTTGGILSATNRSESPFQPK